MDVTTNGPTTLENLEAGKTCKKQQLSDELDIMYDRKEGIKDDS